MTQKEKDLKDAHSVIQDYGRKWTLSLSDLRSITSTLKRILKDAETHHKQGS